MNDTCLSNLEIAAVLTELLERLAGQLTATEYAALHEAGLRLARQGADDRTAKRGGRSA